MTGRPFDVFLSHSSADKQWVRQLKAALQARGVSVWLDEDEIPPATYTGRSLEEGIERSCCMALVVSPEALQSRWVEQEYYAAVSLANRRGPEPFRIIPILLHDARLPLFLDSRTYVDFRNTADGASFTRAVNRLIWGIKGVKPADGRPLKRAAMLDRRLAVELMTLLSADDRPELYHQQAAFLVSASCVYEQLFFENLYGSSLHALLRKLKQQSPDVLVPLPGFEEAIEQTSEIGLDAIDSWLRDPRFKLALARYDRLRGNGSRPREVAEYLNRSLQIARHFDIALIPHPERWPLYEYIFDVSGEGSDAPADQVTVSSRLAPSLAHLQLPGIELDEPTQLPVHLTLHQYSPRAYPIPKDVVPRYDAAFLSQLATTRFEFVTPGRLLTHESRA